MVIYCNQELFFLQYLEIRATVKKKMKIMFERHVGKRPQILYHSQAPDGVGRETFPH